MMPVSSVESLSSLIRFHGVAAHAATDAPCNDDDDDDDTGDPAAGDGAGDLATLAASLRLGGRAGDEPADATGSDDATIATAWGAFPTTGRPEYVTPFEQRLADLLTDERVAWALHQSACREPFADWPGKIEPTFAAFVKIQCERLRLCGRPVPEDDARPVYGDGPGAWGYGAASVETSDR